jgi:hypothetical protein
MEIIKLMWVVIFFLFSLTLLFIWSKLYVLSKRIESIGKIVGDIKQIDEQFRKVTPDK